MKRGCKPNERFAARYGVWSGPTAFLCLSADFGPWQHWIARQNRVTVLPTSNWRLQLKAVPTPLLSLAVICPSGGQNSMRTGTTYSLHLTWAGSSSYLLKKWRRCWQMWLKIELRSSALHLYCRCCRRLDSVSTTGPVWINNVFFLTNLGSISYMKFYQTSICRGKIRLTRISEPPECAWPVSIYREVVTKTRCNSWTTRVLNLSV
jgi:hypothetical protein